MPEIPTIVPLILTGILVGSVLRKTNVSISRKLLVLGSFFGGLGNSANAAALSFLGPTTGQSVPPGLTNIQTITPPVVSGQVMSTQTPFTFIVLSFITGALMVLLVLITVSLTLRIRGRVVLEEQ